MGVLTYDNRAFQIGACCHNGSPTGIVFVIFRADGLNGTILHNQLINEKLLYIQMFLVFTDFLHAELIVLLVCLGSQGMDSRPLTCIQHTELDAGFICCQSHLTSQGIQLPHQMSLAWSSY